MTAQPLTTIHDSDMPVDPAEAQVLTEQLEPDVARALKQLTSDGSRPFTLNIAKADRRHAEIDIERAWPGEIPYTSDVKHLVHSIADMIRDWPVRDPLPTVLLKLSVTNHEPIRINIPQPQEAALLANMDVNKNTVSSFTLPPTPDLPDLATLATHKGLVLMCQPLLPIINPIGDNRGQGMGAGAEVITTADRNRDPMAAANQPREQYMGGTHFDALMALYLMGFFNYTSMIAENDPSIIRTFGQNPPLESAAQDALEEEGIPGASSLPSAIAIGATAAVAARVVQPSRPAMAAQPAVSTGPQTGPQGERRQTPSPSHYREGMRSDDAFEQQQQKENRKLESRAAEISAEQAHSANRYQELKAEEAIASAAEATQESFKSQSEQLTETQTLTAENQEAVSNRDDAAAQAIEARASSAGETIADRNEPIDAAEALAVNEALPTDAAVTEFNAAASEVEQAPESAQAQNSQGTSEFEALDVGESVKPSENPAKLEISDEPPHVGSGELKQEDLEVKLDEQVRDIEVVDEGRSAETRLEEAHTAEQTLRAEEVETARVGELGLTPAEAAEADIYEQSELAQGRDFSASQPLYAQNGHGFVHDALTHRAVEDVAIGGAGLYTAHGTGAALNAATPGGVVAQKAALYQPVTRAGSFYIADRLLPASASSRMIILPDQTPAMSVTQKPGLSLGGGLAAAQGLKSAVPTHPAYYDIAPSAASLAPTVAVLGSVGVMKKGNRFNRPFASMTVGSLAANRAETATRQPKVKAAPRQQTKPRVKKTIAAKAIAQADKIAEVQPQRPGEHPPTLDMG